MPSYFQTICGPAIRLISSFWTRFWRNTLMAHRYQPPVVIFRSWLNNHYECFLTLNVSVITSWHFVPSYLWYLVFGGAPFDFNCASAPRRRNFDLQSYSFRETFLINVLVGRHPRVFRLKHFEKFLRHHQSWRCCKIHFFAVAIFWKVFLYLTLLILLINQWQNVQESSIRVTIWTSCAASEWIWKVIPVMFQPSRETCPQKPLWNGPSCPSVLSVE